MDFNQLEHVLDDAPNVGAWQLEIRKCNDDPLELDELVLHVQKLTDLPEDRLSRELNNRFLERTEIRPNRIVFHDVDEMRHLLGVGTQLKEQKVVDRRPKKSPESEIGKESSTLNDASPSPSQIAALSAATFNKPTNIPVKS